MYGVNNGSAASHRNFAEKYGFSAPLLVDVGLGVANAYDATMGFGPLKVVNRTVVGIGRDGAIAFYERGTPSTDEILTALAPKA